MISRLVTVPGGRVEVLDLPGDENRAPLLFLHEGLGSVGLWRGYPARIAAATGRRVVAYSRFGHGSSDPPPARPDTRFLHEEASFVLPALRGMLGLTAPVLIGHSDGASIALLHTLSCAALRPVTGLVLLAPRVFVEEAGLRAIAVTRELFELSDLRARLAKHHDDPDTAFHGWNDVWLDPTFRSWDLRPELAGITCPILAIQGTADRYGTTAHVEAIRSEVTGPVEVLLLDGGHSPHLDHPDTVTTAITTFLATLP